MNTHITLHDGYADATKRAYQADWKVFESWCREFGHSPLPSTPEIVADFLEAQAEEFKPATLTRRKAAISSIHKDMEHQDPTKSRLVAVALKRAYRKQGRRQKQASPLNREIVDQMLTSDRKSLIAARDAALLSTAYDTGCRRSELVSIQAEDIDRMEDGSATALIRKAKTDQEGNGQVRYLAPDTVKKIDVWLDRSRIESGSLFRSIINGRVKASQLPPRDVSRRFKVMAAAALIEPTIASTYSGHSTRVGMAQDMAAAGIDLIAIMQAGGWKTPTTVSRYVERLGAQRGAAATLAQKQHRSKTRP
ncbi:tyrosine-type recombinase/integrase [Agrobacterium salinitolerans]|nr:tyrosine-type recombinase/integrase [Agrobacterium salinitolerans]